MKERAFGELTQLLFGEPEGWSTGFKIETGRKGRAWPGPGRKERGRGDRQGAKRVATV